MAMVRDARRNGEGCRELALASGVSCHQEQGTMKTSTLSPLAIVLIPLVIACDERSSSPTTASTAATSAPNRAASVTSPPAASSVPPAVKVISEEVTYTAGDTTMKGFLAFPANAKNVGGVLIVHEWWGQNEYVRRRAEMLAKEGYAALAVDMYGEGKTADDPEAAKKLSSAVYGNLDAAVERFRAAKKLLEDHPSADPTKIAAIGYCFGGGIVLHMARTGMDLDVVGSFHGSLSTKTPAKKGEVKATVFVAHGTADPIVPDSEVEAFKKEMEAAGADLRFHAYEGAKHAFTNPASDNTGAKYNLPVAYDASADQASWKALLELLRKELGPGAP